MVQCSGEARSLGASLSDHINVKHTHDDKTSATSGGTFGNVCLL